MNLLDVKEICAGYGKSRVLDGLSLEVGEGEAVSILGRNGSGRSTLLKTIMGALPSSSGSISFDGGALSGCRPFDVVRKGIAYVPEERLAFKNLTVEENLVLGQQPARPGSTRWTIAQMYDYFPRLRERRNTLAGYLSGGEQQMLTIARSLLTNPRLILIDEPTEGLAPQIVEVVMKVILDIRRHGVAVILVEQKLTIALKIVQRVLIMAHGAIVYNGTPEAFSADSSIRHKWLEVS